MHDRVENKIEVSTEPLKVSRRIAVFPKETPVKFHKEITDEKLVQTFPHLIIREVICFQIVVIVVSVLALFFDAPLEELANPMNTPNPAKAPWYFLGLQELLHNFPPLVAGVIIPSLVFVALIIIPYFKINIKRDGLWLKDKTRTFIFISLCFIFISFFSIFYDAYGIFIMTSIMYCLMLIPLFISRTEGFIGWLYKMSLAEWIMIWFVFMVVVLTVIGTLFRGPGWGWILPW